MKTLFATLAALALIPFAAATEVSVSYSDRFTKTLAEDYGTREGDVLTATIKEDLEREFAKRGVAPAKVSVVIKNAKPNRPTFEQIKDKPGLDPFRSRSIGGMDLIGTAYAADGTVIASLDYDWFETDIRDVITAATWWDAGRASSRFARKFAKGLAEDQAAGL